MKKKPITLERIPRIYKELEKQRRKNSNRAMKVNRDVPPPKKKERKLAKKKFKTLIPSKSKHLWEFVLSQKAMLEGCGRREPPLHLQWDCTLVQPLKSETLKELKNKPTIWYSLACAQRTQYPLP